MNTPPKNTAVYAGAGHILTDPFLSNLESSDLTFENRGLKSVVLYSYKLVCTTVIPTVRGNLVGKRCLSNGATKGAGLRSLVRLKESHQLRNPLYMPTTARWDTVRSQDIALSNQQMRAKQVRYVSGHKT
jgi:hypothetical protein